MSTPPTDGSSGGPEVHGLEEEVYGLDEEELEVLMRVTSMLRRIRFGTLLIVVQDGKVVQIETAEKHRLR